MPIPPSWSGPLLSLLRIVAGLGFLHHGTSKYLSLPPFPFPLSPLLQVAGVLELVGGVLIVIGLFTRPVAFVLAGQMAYAFWFVHVPMMGQGNIIPAANGGDGAVLFCFIFLYLVFAGPGAFSVDETMKSRRGAVPA